MMALENLFYVSTSYFYNTSLQELKNWNRYNVKYNGFVDYREMNEKEDDKYDSFWKQLL